MVSTILVPFLICSKLPISRPSPPFSLFMIHQAPAQAWDL